MVFVYIRIYFAAKARARRGIRKSGARPQTAAARTGSGGANEGQHSSTSFTVPPPQQHGQQISTIVTTEHHSGTPGTPAIPIVTCDLASDLSTSDPAPPEDPTVGIYLEVKARIQLHYKRKFGIRTKRLYQISFFFFYIYNFSKF